MESQSVRALGQLHQDRVFAALRSVIFGKFGAQASGLDPNEGVQMRIEIARTPENFGGDLIFLQRQSGMLDGMVGEVPQEFAQRLRTVKSMAIYQLLNLEKSRFNGGYVACHTHLTKGNKLV